MLRGRDAEREVSGKSSYRPPFKMVRGVSDATATEMLYPMHVVKAPGGRIQRRLGLGLRVVVNSGGQSWRFTVPAASSAASSVRPEDRRRRRADRRS